MNKINTTIMDDYLSIINYNELETYLIENKNAFIYVSISDQTVRNFEEKFGKIINKYSLNDNMLYLNLTEEYKDNKLFNNIKKNYKLEGKSCIISFKDGLVDDVYSIDNHNYDLELLTSYLKIKGVIYD